MKHFCPEKQTSYTIYFIFFQITTPAHSSVLISINEVTLY